LQTYCDWIMRYVKFHGAKKQLVPKRLPPSDYPAEVQFLKFRYNKLN
jgi:hypothetical protein